METHPYSALNIDGLVVAVPRPPKKAPLQLKLRKNDIFEVYRQKIPAPAHRGGWRDILTFRSGENLSAWFRTRRNDGGELTVRCWRSGMALQYQSMALQVRVDIIGRARINI